MLLKHPTKSWYDHSFSQLGAVFEQISDELLSLKALHGCMLVLVHEEL